MKRWTNDYGDIPRWCSPSIYVPAGVRVFRERASWRARTAVLLAMSLAG